MKLYLVRHGSALDEAVDPARPLSPKGEKQARITGRFLHDLGTVPEEIWVSEKLRARRTAAIIAKELGLKSAPEPHGGLAPMDPVEELCDELQDRDGDLLIVGHAPFLPRLAALLLDGPETGFFFDTGGVACLERMEPGNWLLTLLISPSELKRNKRGIIKRVNRQ